VVGLKNVKGLFTVSGFQHIVTPLAHGVRGQRPHEVIVVGDEGFHESDDDHWLRSVSPGWHNGSRPCSLIVSI
jgi:hypothetical protein